MTWRFWRRKKPAHYDVLVEAREVVMWDEWRTAVECGSTNMPYEMWCDAVRYKHLFVVIEAQAAGTEGVWL